MLKINLVNISLTQIYLSSHSRSICRLIMFLYIRKSTNGCIKKTISIFNFQIRNGVPTIANELRAGDLQNSQNNAK